MAIATDFTVAVNGDIRHSANTTHYTVLELHRFLQDLADDAAASGDDLVDITSTTPSERSTDNIITLLGTYNIDDNAAEYLYDGSITQDSGNIVYSGLKVLGAVNNTSTQLQIIQDNALYDTGSPFWGTQVAGGYNGNATAGVLMRCLVKSRDGGASIDGKRIRVQARHWGDTYDFFNVTLGVGESVAAVSTTPDAQNDTSQVTVEAYTHIVNSGGNADAPTGGFQGIDLSNGAGSKDYYSKWTYGADTSGDGLKGMWEYLKDLTGNTSIKTVDGLNGELFLGITHSFDYNTEASGPFVERETVFWGTDITYDALAGGTFSAGDYVVFKRATVIINAGRVSYDNGTVNMVVALEDITTAVLDGDVIEEAIAGTVTATINTTILNTDKAGGEGILLALDDNGVTGTMWIQLTSGSAPVASLPIRGFTSSATAAVDGAPTPRTVPKIFQGSYTGSLIGAYGIGVLDTNLSASDSITPLVGTVQIPPNNVTFTVSGLVNGEDRVLVGPKATGDDFAFDQLTLTTTLVAASETSVVVDEAIPADTPASGTLRVTLDDGRIRRIAYSSWTGSTFTVTAESWADPNDATAANEVMISYIDDIAGAASASFTSVYLTSRNLWIRVRDGGGTPIKTFESPGTLGTAGGSLAAIRTTDA